MIAELAAPLLSLALMGLSGCGALAALVIPDEGLNAREEAGPPLPREDPALVYRQRRESFEAHFERDLRACVRGPDCASHPIYSVARNDFDGDEYLGFCDGRIVVRSSRGGLVVTHLDGGLALAQPAGWRRLEFRLAGHTVSTFVPPDAEVRVAPEGDRVRLLGKRGFDLWLGPGGPGGPVAPANCRLTVIESRYFICRRGRAHHVVMHVPLGGQMISAESEPRLRASRRAAEQMVLSAQLLHRVGS